MRFLKSQALRLIFISFIISSCSSRPSNPPPSGLTPSFTPSSTSLPSQTVPTASPSQSPSLRSAPSAPQRTSSFEMIHVSPDRGPVEGHTQLVLFTQGLTAGPARVFLGGIPCTDVNVYPQTGTITCNTGAFPHDRRGQRLDIIVHQDGAIAPLYQAFLVTGDHPNLSQISDSELTTAPPSLHSLLDPPGSPIAPSPNASSLAPSLESSILSMPDSPSHSRSLIQPQPFNQRLNPQRLIVRGNLVNPFQPNPYEIRPTLFTIRNERYHSFRLNEQAAWRAEELRRPWIFMLFPSEEGPGQNAFQNIPLEYIRAYTEAGYNVFYSRVNQIELGTQYIEQIQSLYQAHGIPFQIHHLWLGGHGTPTSLHFSDDYTLTLEDSETHQPASRAFLQLVTPLMIPHHSKIILFSCNTGSPRADGGPNLTQSISEVTQNMGVLGPHGSLPEGTVYITDLHAMTLMSDSVPFRGFLNGTEAFHFGIINPRGH